MAFYKINQFQLFRKLDSVEIEFFTSLDVCDLYF